MSHLGKWKQSSLSHIHLSAFWILRDFSFSCQCKMSNGEIKAPVKQNNVKWSRSLKRSVVLRNNVILWLIIMPVMVTCNVTNQWGLQLAFLIVLWLKVIKFPGAENDTELWEAQVPSLSLWILFPEWIPLRETLWSRRWMKLSWWLKGKLNVCKIPPNWCVDSPPQRRTWRRGKAMGLASSCPWSCLWWGDAWVPVKRPQCPHRDSQYSHLTQDLPSPRALAPTNWFFQLWRDTFPPSNSWKNQKEFRAGVHSSHQDNPLESLGLWRSQLLSHPHLSRIF